MIRGSNAEEENFTSSFGAEGGFLEANEQFEWNPDKMENEENRSINPRYRLRADSRRSWEREMEDREIQRWQRWRKVYYDEREMILTVMDHR